MASERINAILRVINQARFVRDMRGAARGVKHLGTEEEIAALKAKMFSREQRRAAISTAALKDHLSLTRGELMTTAITTSLYTAPALLALGSSATAALLGGAAVGGGGLTALAAGLGGFGLIAIQAFGQIHKVKQALDEYNLTVAQYGEGSKEAADASARLFAVVQQNGGMAVWNLVNAMKALGDRWRALTDPAQQDFFAILADHLKAINRILPTFADQTNRNVHVIRRTLHDAVGILSGAEMRGNLRFFSGAFRAMAPELGDAITNVLLVMLRIFRAAAPYAVSFAASFDHLTQAWERGTRDGGKVNDVVDMLVGHFKSWLGLIKAVGRVLFELFMGSQSEGKGLVDSLTETVNKFADWLHHLRETGQLQAFFHNFGNTLREVAAAILPFVEGVGAFVIGILPTVQDLGQQVTDVLTFLADHIDILIGLVNILSPLIGPMIALWIAWTVAGAALNVVLGVTEALLFLIATPIAAVIVGILAIAAGLAYAYIKWKWFHRAVDNVGSAISNFVSGAIEDFSNFFDGVDYYGDQVVFAIKNAVVASFNFVKGVLSGTLSDITNFFNSLRTVASDTIHFVANRFRDLIDFFSRVPGAISNAIGGAGGSVASLIGKVVGVLPGMATGGIIPPGGVALVGEQGPEIATAGPGGTSITPLSKGMKVGPQAVSFPELNGIIHVYVDTSVKMNRREIARAHGEEVADRKARRGER